MRGVLKQSYRSTRDEKTFEVRYGGHTAVIEFFGRPDKANRHAKKLNNDLEEQLGWNTDSRYSGPKGRIRKVVLNLIDAVSVGDPDVGGFTDSLWSPASRDSRVETDQELYAQPDSRTSHVITAGHLRGSVPRTASIIRNGDGSVRYEAFCLVFDRRVLISTSDGNTFHITDGDQMGAIHLSEIPLQRTAAQATLYLKLESTLGWDGTSTYSLPKGRVR